MNKFLGGEIKISWRHDLKQWKTRCKVNLYHHKFICDNLGLEQSKKPIQCTGILSKFTIRWVNPDRIITRNHGSQQSHDPLLCVDGKCLHLPAFNGLQTLIRLLQNFSTIYKDTNRLLWQWLSYLPLLVDLSPLPNSFFNYF